MDLESTTPPQSQSLTRLLVSVLLILMTDIIGFGIMAPLLPFYAMYTGASAFEVGLLLSVFSLCQPDGDFDGQSRSGAALGYLSTGIQQCAL